MTLAWLSPENAQHRIVGMQSHSPPPPPFGRPARPHVAGPAPDGLRSPVRNEFADAVSRMFEHRQRLAADFAPPLRDDTRSRDDVREDDDDWETPRTSLLSMLVGSSALRYALSIVPIAVAGYAIAWFLSVEPSPKVTAKPVVESTQELVQTVPPPELPAPVRPEVADAKPTPAAEAAVAPSPPLTVATVPSRPLSKDEIKELQDKLGAVGFAVGPIDGIVGPQTQAALRRYAQARSLASQPQATQETLLRLRSEAQASQ